MNSVISFQTISKLRWPIDKDAIAYLDLVEKQVWYSSQDPRTMVYLGQTKEFRSFWYRTYLLPLRIKRTIYKIKKFLHL